MKTKKNAQLAVMSALGICFGYVESLFPLPIPVYGAKLGISNLVVIGALYIFGFPQAFTIMLIKTICTALLFSSPSAFLYSFSGGLISLAVMTVLKKSNRFGTVGVSAAGGAAHNTGQLICAMLILRSAGLIYYLPALLIFGVLSGIVIGILTVLILKRIKVIL